MFPRIPPEHIPNLFILAKKAWNWLKDKFGKIAEDAGSQDPVTQESTIEDIAKINEIFNDFKESVDKQVTEIESKIVVEISGYIDELCIEVEEGNSLLSKYNMNLRRFKRQIDKLKNGIHGTMQNEISKKISLDNLECKKVIKMLPGSKKEEEFKLLLVSAINSAIASVNEKIENIVGNILDDFEVALNDSIEVIEKESNSQIQLLVNAEIRSNDDIQIKEVIKSNANLTIYSCEIIEDIVREEL